MRPAPSGSSSDIEEAHVLRVRLDELAPRLDLVAHERREDEVGRRRVLDLDADEHAARRIHRRVPELLGVHLAQALEAADLHALLREVEREVAKLGVRRRALRLLTQLELE